MDNRIGEKMHQTKPLILLLLLALMSCNNIQQEQRFLPENCFEGDFLPIGKAIYNNNSQKLIELLNSSQVSIDSVGKGGKSGKPTFLMYAVFLEKEEMVNTLLELGADPSKISLIATQKKKIDLNTGEEILYYFQNPLNYASGYIKNISKAKVISGLLIDHGANINDWGSYYYAPLKNAVMGHEGQDAKEMLQFLLSKGANIDAHLDKSGTTILSSISGEWQLVDFLLEKGADPKIIDFIGWDFMWDVENRISTSSKKPHPELEVLKNKLIEEYGLKYPAEQNKEKGDSIRKVEYEKKGWTYNENGKLITPEDIIYYDELRGR